jgi:hypothetical protein
MCCESFFPFPVDVALKLSTPPVIPADADPALGCGGGAEPGPIFPLTLIPVQPSVADDNKLIWETAQT